jgi:hypothetical protein
MTATNHVLTGAVIALAVKQPALAVPLAILSHFVLDALPHFALKSGRVFDYEKKSFANYITPIDATVATAILVWLGFFLDTGVSNLLVVICAIAAYLPDVFWIPTFIRELKTHIWEPKNWFLKFHQKIQWRERPWGIYIELVWAVGAVFAIEALK